jgi:hypothetical protein
LGESQDGRWKQRFTRGKAQPFRIEVTFRKVLAADAVEIFFDRLVFLGVQHGQHFLLLCELEQIVVVPGVGAERLAVTLQQLYYVKLFSKKT